MAGAVEASPSWRENIDTNLARLHLERDTVNNTIDILHRQSSLIDEMLALVRQASTTADTTMQERLTPDGDEDALTANENEKTSAAVKCLAVTELLEKILLCLSPIQLFGVVRVNRKFRDTIEGSQLLRQRMLLEPSAVPLAWRYLKEFIGASKMACATCPFEFQFFPCARQDRRRVQIEVWVEFTKDTEPELEGSLVEEIEIESWRRFSEIQRVVVDVQLKSWSGIRLDMPLEIRYHALVPPYDQLPECLEVDYVVDGLTIGALMEKIVQRLRKHCSHAGCKDIWVGLETKVLRKTHGCGQKHCNHRRESFTDAECLSGGPAR